jgi:DNA-binding response OmpR family regulator/DNA-binding CsgD family transcriptional regulator
VDVADGRPRILVVEDEADLAGLVEVNLSLAGYDVVTAPSGEDGLVEIADREPDAVLLDVLLPGVDGWSVLRTIKEERATRDLPIIMLTALSEERDLIRGHLQGAVEYVTKPFDMDRLLATVEAVLREPTPDELADRRRRTRTMLQRLAELDSGRTADRNHVRLSALERTPAPTPDETSEAAPEQVAGLATMTDKQRWLASALGAGWSARQVAEHLDVSRSNVYATRRRVARRLHCEPDEVAEVARALGIQDEVSPPPDGD